MRAPWRTLRGRMVVLNAVLMLLALTVVAVASATFLRSYLVDRVDERIETSAAFVRAHQDDIFAQDPYELVEQIRTPSDFVAEFVTRAPGDPHPRVHRLQGAGPTLVRDIDTDNAPEGVFTVEHDGSEYRVMVLDLPDHDTVVLTGEPLDPVGATVHRLVAIQVLVGLAMLGLALLAGTAVIRRGLRPLDDVVETAEAIALGDLERRVPEPAPGAAVEVSRLTLSINRMLARLRGALHGHERSEERLRRFVSDASHELRTPLTSIRGYLQLVAQGVVDVAKRPDVITRSQQESERMAAIVDDLLYLARLDERPAPRHEVVELGRIVADSVADARAAQPEREWRTEASAEGLVVGDEQELRQVVSNLLANVRVHTPAAGPATVRLRRVDGRVVLEVADGGPGMDEESAAFVFERFYRGASASGRPGSGLGLPIVRAVMRAHGGEAEFASAAEEGSTVTLRFPAPPDPEPDPLAHHRDDDLTGDGAFSSKSHGSRHFASSRSDGLAAKRTGLRGTSMAGLLYRLGGFAYRRRWLVVVSWLLVLVVAAGAALMFRAPLNDALRIPGTESEQATDLMEARFSTTGESVTAVLSAPEGSDVIEDEQYADAVRATADELADAPKVETVISPHGIVADARQQYEEGIAEGEEEALEAAREGVEGLVPPQTPNRDQVIAEQLPEAEEQALAEVARQAPDFDEEEVLDQVPQLSDDRDTVMLQVQLDARNGEVPAETVDAILATGDEARDAGMDVEFSGPAITNQVPSMGASEAVGLVAALVVLVINFGALITAGLPILLALIGVGVGMMLLYASSSLIELTSTAPILALMLGIAVGIDYSLFVLSRHRKQVSQGWDPAESAARAIGTAGSAVVFAGATVIIALLGLSVVRIPFLTIMGVAAMVTVAVAVLVAITLLPALLGFVGHRVTAGRLPVLGRRAERAMVSERTMSARWIGMVTRRPLIAVLGVAAVLGTLLLPLGSMHLGLPSDETSSEDTTQRQAYEIISEEFGPGHTAQLAVVADLTGLPDMPAAADEVAERMEDVDGVAEVFPPQLSEVQDTAIIVLIPETGPSDTATEDVLHQVRGLQDEVDEETGAKIVVAGATAAAIDISERLADALPVFATVVIGLALVLMTVVFRSVLVPVKAALGFVLSAGASLGLTVVVFQWGHGAALFGVEPGPLLAFMPTLVIGILFGLAMDYEVFLVSRMREDFVHGSEPMAAISSGFTQGARVVTAAAAIMISVFASFVFGHVEMLKPIAFVLAVGILIDAFLVRMTLGPAVMALFGRATWWLPRWLDRLLPNVDIEGDRLNATAPATGGGSEGSDGGDGGGEGAQEPRTPVDSRT
ncbi:MMPL family transporter [Nocardiopsis terrae]